MDLGLRAPLEDCPTRIDNQKHCQFSDIQNKTMYPISYWARKAKVKIGTFRYRAKIIYKVNSLQNMGEKEFLHVIASFRKRI